MAWTLRFDPRAQRDLARLDHSIRRKIIAHLETRVAGASNPEQMGKPLRGELAGLWRYRVQDHRILCRLLHEQVVILVIAVGHRKDIYER